MKSSNLFGGTGLVCDLTSRSRHPGRLALRMRVSRRKHIALHRWPASILTGPT